MDVVHAFALKGSCPWCDRHQGWVEEQPKPKRAVQRKKSRSVRFGG
jgi:hypothetical protein